MQTGLSGNLGKRRPSSLELEQLIMGRRTNLEHLTPQLVAEIQHFFEVYKALEPGKTSSTAGLAGRQAAWDEIAKALANFPRHA